MCTSAICLWLIWIVPKSIFDCGEMKAHELKFLYSMVYRSVWALSIYPTREEKCGTC